MIQQFRKNLKKVSDPKKAEFVARYFKTGKGEYGEGDEFVGATVPDCRVIARKYRDLSIADVQKLLRSKIHEERLIALMILVLQFESGSEKDKERIFRYYIINIKYVNNWDLVDSSADHIVGGYLLDSGQARMTVLNRLVKSKNIWERRIAIIATNWFIKNNQFEETLKVSEMLLKDTHDLIHKAVGWMLREIGKKDQKVLEEFLKTHLKTMSRTTLRYAIERFPEKMRKGYLRGEISS